MIGSGIVIIERTGTTETGIGIGTGTGKEIEIVDVIEIEHVIGIVTVNERGTRTGTENMIDIVKGIEIMKLGILIEDAHVIGSLTMIVLNLNTRDRHGEREHDYEAEDDRGWYHQPEHGHRHADPDHDPEQYDNYEHHRGRGEYDHGDDHGDHYNQYPDDRMEDDYHMERATSESRERERNRDIDCEYRRSERSHSPEYDY